MKKIIQAVGFVVCFVVSTSAFSQIIWQKAAKGMSVNQVKVVFPSANNMIPSKGESLGDGAVPLLQITNYEISGTYFTAYFYFKESKLIQVTLKANPEQNQEVAFTKMLQAFRMKYGEEFNEDGYGLGVQKSWITKDKTKITLSYLIGKLNIYYSSREVDELNKL